MGLLTHKSVTARIARRRLTAWMAIVALVFQMLVPFAQALAFDADEGIEFQYICTVTGIEQIPFDQNGGPVEPSGTIPCPFCLQHLTPALFTPQNVTIIIIDKPVEHAVFGLPVQEFQASIWRGSLRPSRAPPHVV